MQDNAYQQLQMKNCTISSTKWPFRNKLNHFTQLKVLPYGVKVINTEGTKAYYIFHPSTYLCILSVLVSFVYLFILSTQDSLVVDYTQLSSILNQTWTLYGLFVSLILEGKGEEGKDWEEFGGKGWEEIEIINYTNSQTQGG